MGRLFTNRTSEHAHRDNLRTEKPDVLLTLPAVPPVNLSEKRVLFLKDLSVLTVAGKYGAMACFKVPAVQYGAQQYFNRWLSKTNKALGKTGFHLKAFFQPTWLFPTGHLHETNTYVLCIL